ncbi:MAP kinase [Neoconidiobolus thromboides FSU 785]|nr:MAP kinase [Neoconidiobolus thromboides FSU 785]
MRQARPSLRLKPQEMKLNPAAINGSDSPFAAFSKFVDPSGKLNFGGKAIVHEKGVDFSNGNSYKINMKELELMEVLGKGMYGTVQKAFHKPTKVIMAMKEIRLELDQAKLNQILMELDVLHKSQNPYIVDFYGAFFVESCVYYCMEFMDCGSLDLLCWKGVPEPILARITESMIKGLKFLKDELSIIHRDVKPTNILVNSKGEVKLCDFGVSGQLVMSMAKTHIGCQSYMAPERITSSSASSYTVQSDIWSVGLTMLEVATGDYPYSDKNYDSVFARLNAIVMTESPTLPEPEFSPEARDFVSQCLRKKPEDRPTYSELLGHPFLVKYRDVEVDMEDWAKTAFENRKPPPKEIA